MKEGLYLTICGSKLKKIPDIWFWLLPLIFAIITALICFSIILIFNWYFPSLIKNR
jgi:hypothetical protein